MFDFHDDEKFTYVLTVLIVVHTSLWAEGERYIMYCIYHDNKEKQSKW